MVGLLLTSFGIFWTGEGLGVDWPGTDLSILGLLVIFAGISLATMRILRSGIATRQGVAR